MCGCVPCTHLSIDESECGRGVRGARRQLGEQLGPEGVVQVVIEGDSLVQLHKVVRSVLHLGTAPLGQGGVRDGDSRGGGRIQKVTRSS